VTEPSRAAICPSTGVSAARPAPAAQKSTTGCLARALDHIGLEGRPVTSMMSSNAAPDTIILDDDVRCEAGKESG
jgi:hypothetical protein